MDVLKECGMQGKEWVYLELIYKPKKCAKNTYKVYKPMSKLEC